MFKLQFMLKLMLGLGFVMAIMYDPDVPGREDSTMKMMIVYGTCLNMIVIPFVIQKIMSWGWFSDLDPDEC